MWDGYGLGGSVSLWEWDLRFSMFRIPSVSGDFLFPARCSSHLQYHICLHATMLLIMILRDWTIKSVSESPQLNVFLIKVAMVMVSLQSNKSLKKYTFPKMDLRMTFLLFWWCVCTHFFVMHEKFYVKAIWKPQKQ